MAGTLILFKWSLDEVFTHLTTLSALAADTVSEQTKQDFEKFVISEDEKLFVSSNIESPLLRVASFFRRITPDEVQPIVNDNEVGFSFVPRIIGGKFSHTDESLLRAKSFDMICAQILVRWYALRSIAPLANWLSQEYSRSAVELETTLQQFIRPAYVGRATTIVEVDGDIDPKVQDNTTNVTYEQLLTLIGSSALIPNREYRITDYSASVADDAILVAVGHRYDIIVHADTPNSLSERARAAHSIDDSYFNDAHLSAWDIRYSAQNDTARFPWCNPNGKGVVYYLCDEYGNRAGYDFKNICFDTEMGRLYSISVMDNETGELLDGSLFCATQCSFLGQAPQPNAILLNQGESADRVMIDNCTDVYVHGTAKDVTATSCKGIIINLPYSENIHIGPYTSYLELYTTDNCTAEHPARNIYVHSGVKGTADNYENVNISVLPTDYRLEVANNALGKVRVYILGSGGSIIEPGSVDTEAFAPTAIAPEARRISKGLTITTKNGSTRFDGEFETNITIPSGEYDEEIEILRQQVDRKADTYYQPTDPSLDWPTQDYAIHEGDLWQDTTINKTFRWNGTEWEPFEVPLEVFDAIDGKSSIYTVRPNSYQKNDLWILEAEFILADGVMYSAGTIVIALVSSDVFDRSHWTKRDRYTDDVATNKAINNLNVLVKDLQNQIDGNVTSYEGTAIPTLDNYPANEWETIEEKERQIGSYYDQRVPLPDGTTMYKRFRFSKIADGVYEWTELANSDVSEAIAAAREALGLAGTKARLFYGDGAPVPPYNINDIWVMTTGVIYICNADRAEGDMVEITDWQLANDAALRLRNIAADNMVTMEEKSALRNLLSQVRKEYAKYVEDAEKYGVDITALQEAYRDLIDIFTTVFEVEYNTDTVISDNDRDLYNNAYANFYAEITRFTDAIADKKIQDAIADVSTDIVVRVDVEYRLSDSATEVTGDYPDWSTEAPEWIQGTYMWQRTVTVYRSGDTITVGPTCIAGAKGDAGVGIKSITEEYYLSSSPTELKGGEWKPTPPVWVYGKYYWTRSVILYTDGSSETTTPICVSAGAVYTLDLTNQMAGVIATAEGEIITELPTSTAIVYYGSEIDEGWSFSGVPEGCEATINKDSGEIVITAITADVAKVVITATKSMAPTLTTTFNVLVVRDGKEGAPATIYHLSVSADKITKSLDGTVTPSEITVAVYKVTGRTEREEITTPNLKYQRVPNDRTEVSYSGPIAVQENTTKIYIRLYDDNGNLLDAESIPVLPDIEDIEDMDERLDNAESAITGIKGDTEIMQGLIEALELDVDEIKSQKDQEFTIWSIEDLPNIENEDKYVPAPNANTTTPNYPAELWTTPEQIATHEQDIFYNRYSGHVWKFVSGLWEDITDAQTLAALEKALEAYRLAMEAKEAANAALAEMTSNKEVIAKNMGYNSFENMADNAAKGETIIKKGLINTKLLVVDDIVAGQVAVTQKNSESNIKESAIFINPQDIFKVVDFANSDNEGGNLRMQVDKNGMRLYKTTSDGDLLTAQYSGNEVSDIETIVPTIDAQVLITEMALKDTLLPKTQASDPLTYVLCEYTNNLPNDVAISVGLRTLSMIFRCYGGGYLEGRNEPLGKFAITTYVEIQANNTTERIHEKTFEVTIPGIDEWEHYIDPDDQSGTIQYSGDFLFRDKLELDGKYISLPANATMRIVTTFSCVEDLVGCDIMYATRVGTTSGITGSAVIVPLSVSTTADKQQLLMSNYYGNGFVIAKSLSNYIAAICSDTMGTQIEVMNGNIGFRIANGVICAKSNATWVPLSWDKIVDLLKS